MKAGFNLIVWASVLAAASASAADCRAKLADVDKLATEIAVPDAKQLELRQLREAAGLLLQNGQNAMCEDVADKMKDSLQDRREVNREAAKEQKKLEHLTSAAQISALTGVVRATNVIGLKVRSPKNEKLGEIENIAIDAASGQVAYAVMSHGGFLGLGKKLIPIPWSRLRRTADGEVFVLEVDDKALDKIAGFDKKSWPSKEDADRYWLK